MGNIAITTNINSGSFGAGLEYVKELEHFLDAFPEKLMEANQRALNASKGDIDRDIQRRGRPGKYIDVDIQKYGDYGLSVRIHDTPDGANGHATRMFLQSEQGLVGRRAFVLNKKTYYVISHDSGKWGYGTHLGSPVNVPAVPPFAFSSKNSKDGDANITIKQMAYNSIVKNLNRQHRMLLRRER
jgi:hypothetical protein